MKLQIKLAAALKAGDSLLYGQPARPVVVTGTTPIRDTFGGQFRNMIEVSMGAMVVYMEESESVFVAS